MIFIVIVLHQSMLFLIFSFFEILVIPISNV